MRISLGHRRIARRTQSGPAHPAMASSGSQFSWARSLSASGSAGRARRTCCAWSSANRASLAAKRRGIVQELVQHLPELIADPVSIHGDHEADPVVAGAQIHGVIEAIDDAGPLPHDVCESRHVDVVQLAMDVAGLHQGDLAVVVGVVGMIRELAVGDEPSEQLAHDGSCGVVLGELIQVGK
jgi:hypothetical protein